EGQTGRRWSAPPARQSRGSVAESPSAGLSAPGWQRAARSPAGKQGAQSAPTRAAAGRGVRVGSVLLPGPCRRVYSVMRRSGQSQPDGIARVRPPAPPILYYDGWPAGVPPRHTPQSVYIATLIAHRELDAALAHRRHDLTGGRCAVEQQRLQRLRPRRDDAARLHRQHDRAVPARQPFHAGEARRLVVAVDEVHDDGCGLPIPAADALRAHQADVADAGLDDMRCKQRVIDLAGDHRLIADLQWLGAEQAQRLEALEPRVMAGVAQDARLEAVKQPFEGAR